MGTAASVCKAVARVLKEDVNWELGELTLLTLPASLLKLS